MIFAGFLLITIIFVGYAIYLRWKLFTGKGRFALAVVSAIAASAPTIIVATSQLSLIDVIWYAYTFITTGTLPSPQYPAPLKILDYIFIYALGYTVIRALVTFGQFTVMNWDGPVTRIDARMAEAGESPDLLSVARAYAALKLAGLADTPIDPKALDRDLPASDTPPDPTWPGFCRELILEAMNELSIPDAGWSDELGCWVGSLIPRYNSSDPLVVAVVPISDPQQFNATASVDAIVRTSLGAIKRVYFCLDTDVSHDIQRSRRGTPYRELSKDTLLALGLNLRSYADDLVRRYEVDEILGSGRPLSELYVPPTLYRPGSDDVSLPFDRVIDEWAASATRENLSIVGQFGQGKSTAILAYCAKWARAYIENGAPGQRVPLLIPLRGRDPSVTPRQEFLAAWGARYRLSGKALLNLVAAGRALLFFEGFDEVNNAGLRSQRVKQFEALWNFSFPRSKIAFTGRPNFFLDDFELRRLLRIDEHFATSGYPYSTLYSLTFFDAEQTRLALRSFDKSIADGIVARFRGDAHFRDVARRPSMLPLIAVIWDTIKSEDRDSTITSANVIERYIDFEYSRKSADIAKDAVAGGLRQSDNYLRIPRRIKDFYMMCVARFIAQSPKINTITGDDFYYVVNSAFDFGETYIADNAARPDEIAFFAQVNAAISETNREEAVEKLTSELRTTGMLASDPVGGPTSLYFPHKQFFEYYLARFCCTAIERQLRHVHSPEYDAYMSTRRPCAPLLREPQALGFFSELADIRWFNSVFTRKGLSVWKPVLVVQYVFNTIYAPVNRLMLNNLIFWRLRRPKMEDGANDTRNIESPTYPGKRRPAVVFVSIFIASMATMLIYHYTAASLSFFGGIAISLGLGFAMLFGRGVVDDVILWYDLLQMKDPGGARQIGRRALLPFYWHMLEAVVRERERRRELFYAGLRGESSS